jgi:hypothetical protein
MNKRDRAEFERLSDSIEQGLEGHINRVDEILKNERLMKEFFPESGLLKGLNDSYMETKKEKEENKSLILELEKLNTVIQAREDERFDMTVKESLNAKIIRSRT